MTPRPVIERFASVMEEKLQENDHKGGWHHDSPGDLFARLLEEAKELAVMLDATGVTNSVPPRLEPGQARLICREASDVANFAMMIADVCKGLGAIGFSLRPGDEHWMCATDDGPCGPDCPVIKGSDQASALRKGQEGMEPKSESLPRPIPGDPQ